MIPEQHQENVTQLRPPGMAEYQCRTAIRDLIEEIGPQKAKELIESFVTDEADRRPRHHG